MTDTKQPIVKEVQPSTLTDFQSLIESIRQTGNEDEKQLIASLSDYIVRMAPDSKLTNDEGARYQYNLWKAISNLAENVSADRFKRCWNILLLYFKEYKNNVFAERYVFRFSEYWRWSGDELKALQCIINILMLTNNIETRTLGLKQVDLRRSLEVGFTDLAKQKIINFYNT